MIAAAAGGLHRCELVARRAAGDRAYDVYCHYLPRSHRGDCEPEPTAERMGQEWHRAMLEQAAYRERLHRVAAS